jgi:hypothetical protein
MLHGPEFRACIVVPLKVGMTDFGEIKPSLQLRLAAPDQPLPPSPRAASFIEPRSRCRRPMVSCWLALRAAVLRLAVSQWCAARPPDLSSSLLAGSAGPHAHARVKEQAGPRIFKGRAAVQGSISLRAPQTRGTATALFPCCLAGHPGPGAGINTEPGAEFNLTTRTAKRKSPSQVRGRRRRRGVPRLLLPRRGAASRIPRMQSHRGLSGQAH